jgi:predicted  nucleic acid-binding Zn-ribbon protein
MKEDAVQDSRGSRPAEDEIEDLTQSLNKPGADEMGARTDLARDVTNTIHRIDDHIVALPRRIERLEEGVEESEEEWTTRGWEPPTGADRSPGEAS